MANQSEYPILDLAGQKPGKRLCIYIGESDRWRGKPLDTAILEVLKSNGLAGATVFRGVSGFGAHSHIRSAAIEVLSVDLPVLIEAVDSPERIQRAYDAISPMVGEGLITLEDVTIMKYLHRYMNLLPADKPVTEVMTGDVFSLLEAMSIREAWEKMVQNGLKALPVVDKNGVVTGILTDEDLLNKAGIHQRLSVALRLGESTLQEDLRELGETNKKVKDVMTHPAITILNTETLGTAVSKMVKKGLKRAPVTNGTGQLVGMLSRLDILGQVVEMSPHVNLAHAPAGTIRTVKDIMRPDIPAVRKDERLATIIQKFVRFGSHRLIVVDENGMAIGLIADSDIVARVQAEKRGWILDALRNLGKPPSGTETAAEIMSPGVTKVRPDTLIAEAARLMLSEGRKWLVVADENDVPVGLIDRRALLESLASLF